jgi:hypothetical protein
MGQPGEDAQAAESPRTGAKTVACLAALALFITLLNAVKPLTVDDSVYHLFAAHIAEHPLDPYGFRAWGVQDANSILAPPVFLYWWAAAERVAGPEPLYAKLWLMPFNLLLVIALHALGRRFTRGLELPFVCTVTLSSAVLPCMNLMLDVPALALGLLAVVLFLRACEAGAPALALAAGLVAALAAQTKYTAFVAPAVMALSALRSRRYGYAAVAVGVPVLLFVAWEWWVARQYGASHFWLGCMQYPPSATTKLRLIQPLVGSLGSGLAAGVPLALAALGRSARLVGVAAALIGVGFALIAFVPDGGAARLPALSGVLFGVNGVILIGALAVIAGRLVRRPADAAAPAGRVALFSADAFLVLWLGLEVAGYFALSPYPAARRVLGVGVVGTLLAFRLAAQTCRARPRMIGACVAVNALLGLLSFAVDYAFWHGQQVMARQVAGACRRQASGARVWFFGNGTFEFYGERAGMKHLILPDEAVSPGDWILVVDGFEPEYGRHPVAARCVRQGVREWYSALPWRSQYQAGNVTLAHERGPLGRVTFYRAW